MNSYSIKRGEIFYVHFDKSRTTEGSEQTPGRPGVVVSNNLNNKHSETVEVCYLTLRDKTPLPTHVYLDEYECCPGSTVLCEQITTVSVNRLGDYKGTVSKGVMKLVDEALLVSLGLSQNEEKSDIGEEQTQYAQKEITRAEDSTECAQALDIAALEGEIKELREEKVALNVYKTLYTELVNKLIGNK